MIIKTLFEMILNILRLIFSVIPGIPKIPEIVTAPLNEIFGIIENVKGFINFIFPLTLGFKLIVIVLLIENFQKIYRLSIFILKKIPFLGIN